MELVLPFYASFAMYISLTFGCFMLIMSIAKWKSLHPYQRTVRSLIGLMLLYSVIIRILFYSPESTHTFPPFFLRMTVFDIFYILISGVLMIRMLSRGDGNGGE